MEELVGSVVVTVPPSVSRTHMLGLGDCSG